jgi:FixJ family two-component response regulator
MLQPRKLMRRLKARHSEGMTRRQLQVLGAIDLGYSSREIASGLGLAEPTVRREVSILAARVLERDGLPPTPELLRKWASLHYDCCASETMKMIENDQPFDRGDQHGAADTH